MGKKLIIKGADFSRNCVPTDSNSLFDELKDVFEPGYGITESAEVLVKSANSKRCCIYGFDLSEYAALGYTHIEVVSTSLSVVFILAIGSPSDNKVYDASGNVTEWNWFVGTVKQGDFYGSNLMYLNFKNSDDSDFDATVKFEDLIDYVELS